MDFLQCMIFDNLLENGALRALFEKRCPFARGHFAIRELFVMLKLAIHEPHTLEAGNHEGPPTNVLILLQQSGVFSTLQLFNNSYFFLSIGPFSPYTLRNPNLFSMLFAEQMRSWGKKDPTLRLISFFHSAIVRLIQSARIRQWKNSCNDSLSLRLPVSERSK